MGNLMSFLSWLASYTLVYFVFIAAIIVAFAIGFTIRKNKNKKEATETVDTASEQ